MINFLKQLFNKKTPVVNYGILPDVPDVRDIQYGDLVSAIELPEKYINDISSIFRLNQMSIGACVAHAGCHYLSKTEDSTDELSARFLYALMKYLDQSPQMEGTYPRILAKAMKDFGTTDAKTVPNNTFMSHADYIKINVNDPVLLKSAQSHKVGGFAYVNTADIQLMKKAIVKEKGFVMSMRVGDWSGQYVYPYYPQSDLERNNGRHMVYIYGYDGDDFYGLNSWSPSWGYYNNGTFKFSYNDYKNGYLYEAITFSKLVTQDIIDEARKKRYIFPRALGKGMRGDDVVQLQKRLNEELGAKIPLTGYFGTMTMSHVKLYQAKYGLKQDGFVGRITLNTLNK